MELDFGKEIRLKDPVTGGEKGSKQAQISLIPVYAQIEEAKVYGMGAEKYAAWNWRRGYPWSWSWDAYMRHNFAFWNGEDLDPESGLPHLAHARWHTGVMLEFWRYGLGTDDRISAIVAAAEQAGAKTVTEIMRPGDSSSVKAPEDWSKGLRNDVGLGDRLLPPEEEPSGRGYILS